MFRFLLRVNFDTYHGEGEGIKRENYCNFLVLKSSYVRQLLLVEGLWIVKFSEWKSGLLPGGMEQ